MSNSVLIRPLGPGITLLKVKEIFAPFITEKIIVKGDKAYIKFADANDIDSLQMKYDDGAIPELGNAQIVPVPEDFSWALIEGQDHGEKELKTSDFILPGKKSEEKMGPVNPRFVVISECDPKILDSLSQDYIRKRIFGKYKIGRVIQYKRDVYIQFLDENEIETLEVSFPGLAVKELGNKASAGPTDDNFSYEVVQDQVQKYEREKKLEREREEAEKVLRAKREAAELEQIRRTQQKRIQSGEYMNFNIRPQGERESYLVGDSKKTQLFWAVTVVLWGMYIIFM